MRFFSGGLRMYKQFEINNKGKLKPGIIEAIEIGLTQRCNFKCTYCGAYKNDKEENDGDLHLLLNKIDKIKTLQEVSLSGGEVTLNFNECIEICDFCNRKGIDVQLNTNGSLLTSDRIIELKKHGLKTIHFSLNFASATDYSNYYGVDAKVYSHLLEMIEKSQIIDNCVVESIICNDFKDNLCRISQLLGQYPNVIYQLQYGMNKDTWDNGLNKAETLEILEEIFKHKPNEQIIVVSCISISSNSIAENRLIPYIKKGNIHFIECNDGRQRFHLDRNGDLIACDIGFPYKFGNLFDDTFDICHLAYDKQPIVSFISNHLCSKACVLE